MLQFMMKFEVRCCVSSTYLHMLSRFCFTDHHCTINGPISILSDSLAEVLACFPKVYIYVESKS